MAVWSVVKLSEFRGAFRMDAEFWRPEYIAIENTISAMTHAKLGDLVTSIRKGVFNILAESYVEAGVPFYRSANVGEIIPKDADTVFITERRHAEEHRTALRRGDIMLAKTGKEAASVVLAKECNVSQDVVAIRPDRKKINPFYLAVFLNTQPGVLQMRRWFQGPVQMHLSLPDTREIFIPLLEPARQKSVEAFVLGSEAALKKARDLIVSAETLLVSALGLDHIDLSPSRTYSRPFKDLLAAHRYGAEYYMPSKQRALDALAAMPHSTLHDHAPNIRDLWEPESAGKGAMVRNFDLGDALEPFLDDTKEPMLAAEVGSTKKQFKAGDVVVSRLRSYLREIAVARTGSGVPCVGSSEFIVLRPTGKGLSAETILVYLRCPLVQTILKWSQDGSNHPRFNEDDLMTLPVPDKLREVSPKIERHVQAAIASRQEAVRLLDNAKTIVQKAILGETGS